MEFLLWIVGIGLVLWLFEAARDSTYKEMVEDMQQTDEEVASRKAEIENQARLEKEEALSKARYALIDDPRHGTVTWAGRGRKPKWLVDYLAEGGSLSELEYPKKRVINSESFIIRVNEKLEEGNGPQGNFADREIKDVRGNLWFDPDGTLYDYDGVPQVPLEILLALKAEGFNTIRMEDDHVDTEG